MVKDDSGSYAVVTEQGSSASHMTAAEVLDVISRLADCAGKASDAVSAYTQVKMEDAPDVLRLPKSGCPTIWIRLPRSRCPNSLDKMEDPVDIQWQDCVERCSLKENREKVRGWECRFVHSDKGLFLSVNVDDIKMEGTKKNLKLIWDMLSKT